MVGAYDAGPVLDVSFVAGGTLTSSQYYFVKLSADNTVVICNDATDKPIGILQNKPASGQSAKVRIIGISKLVSSGIIGYGTDVGTDANGKAVAKTTNKDIAPCVVLQGAGGDGEIMVVAVNCANANRMSL